MSPSVNMLLVFISFSLHELLLNHQDFTSWFPRESPITLQFRVPLARPVRGLRGRTEKSEISVCYGKLGVIIQELNFLALY